MTENSLQNKSSPFVSVIILNWNGRKYLDDCLGSLSNQTYSNLEIFLVDNNSHDDSVEFVNKNFPMVKIIKNKENLGFSAGNNVGMKMAMGKYLFILNNDTKVAKNCIKFLTETIEKDGKIGMAAPKILSFENPNIIDSVGVNIYFDGMSRGRGRKEEDRGQYDHIQEILLPSGCAAFYRKEMLDEIGLFDESFFIYCEDSDLGLRGRLAGWKTILIPSAIVYHHYSGTIGEYSSRKAFFVERNHFWLAIKNFPLALLLLLPFFTLKRYLFLISGALRGQGPLARFQSSKIELFYILTKSYLSAIVGVFSVFKKRIVIQKNKKITNKDFYKLIKRHLLKISEVSSND